MSRQSSLQHLRQNEGLLDHCVSNVVDLFARVVHRIHQIPIPMSENLLL